MWRNIIATAFFFVLIDATPVKFQDCGSKYGVLHLIDISPCPKSPCQLPLDSNVNMKVQFQAKVATKSVYISMNADVDGSFPQPVPLPDYMGCDQGVNCPVKVGDRNTLSTSIYLESDFPTVDIGITLELQDDNLDDMVCAKFNVTLVEENMTVKEKNSVLRFERSP